MSNGAKTRALDFLFAQTHTSFRINFEKREKKNRTIHGIRLTLVSKMALMAYYT